MSRQLREAEEARLAAASAAAATQSNQEPEVDVAYNYGDGDDMMNHIDDEHALPFDDEDVVMRGAVGTESEWDINMSDDEDLPISDSESDGMINAEALRDGDIEDIAARPAVDLEDVLGAGEYEECIWVGGRPDESVPFDEDDVPEPTPIPGAQPDSEDTSILIPTRQNRSIETSSFEKALATFADLTGLSRQDWASLREILFLIRDKDGDTPAMIQGLPKQLSTLRDRMRSRMPMMHMREADIPLNILKLPTLPATLKPEERRRVEDMRACAEVKAAAVSAARAAIKTAREKGRDSAEARAATKVAQQAKARAEKLQAKAKANTDEELQSCDLPRVTMRLTFFDPPTMFKNIVASDIGIKGPVIFPSDWVYFRCLDSLCELHCHDIADDSDDIVNIHIGRVYGIQEAHRSQSRILTSCAVELEWWGREVFQDQWDQAREGTLPVVSFPHIDFIDGFGVFSNSYRTLMGFYFTPAGLTEKERARPGSIFPIVLGPHASNFSDVIKALRTMALLDAGMIMDINGEQVRLCAFAICYTGDMPQQAENSGFKGPRAHKFCRCCFAFAGQRAVDPDVLLKFDITTHGRFHVQTTEMQHMLTTGLKNASERKRFCSQWGMAEELPALLQLSPALDLVLSRPLDPAHSEYNGLGNLMHFLLRDGILTKTARAEYALELRTWPFPPGWQRLQSPIHHLSSYKMSNHAQWIIIIPAFLLNWLKKDHIKPSFYQQAERDTGSNPVKLVIETTAAIAKSTTVLMGSRISAIDRKDMRMIVYRARHLFN
ncbi:hypothetical protein C8A05DRAFT_39905, partial [Staphylotrichum tortipilum]